jgi:ABC-type lipoprotein release transport system permease subunit
MRWPGFHTLAAPYPFKSWAEQMPDPRQLIDLNYLSMSLVTVLVLGVVSLGIACGFVIFILKNFREYGIMKAMGTTPGELAYLIFTQVVLMNRAASCLGVLAGAVAVVLVGRTGIDLTAFTSHNRYVAVSAVIFPRLTAYSLGLPPVLACLFSLAATIWPVALVARKKAAAVLRMV